MQDNYIRMDLALIENRKGTLVLDNNGLSYTSKKGLNFSIPVTDIRNVSFIKTSLKTSTLIINEMEITVCRAHLWAADINNIRKVILGKDI
ncbi:MAG: hypothetical protein M1306_00535 [Candidatus Thermoplasmatota archaeon]|nr:hypothetical protein [Candidatus Thermoplasmatota archaeon]